MSRPLNRCPATYEASKPNRDAHFDAVLSPLMDKMSWGTNELILEHGCKSGSTCFQHLLPKAEETNSTIYAVDNCEASVTFGEENFSHPRIKYIHGTWESDELKDMKFNKIFSFYTLHYIQNYREELKNLYEHLAEGGEMLLITVTKCHTYDLFKMVDEKWGHHGKDQVFPPDWLSEGGEPEDILKKVFNELGFETKYFKCYDICHTFENPGVFANLMFSRNSFAKHLPTHEHDELRDYYHKFFIETETTCHKPGPDSATSEYDLEYEVIDVLLKKP